MNQVLRVYFRDLKTVEHHVTTDDPATAKIVAEQLSIQFGEAEIVFSDGTWEKYKHGRHVESSIVRAAMTDEIYQAVDAYATGVLTDRVQYAHLPNCRRPFDGATDSIQVQMALALKGLDARTTSIIEAALRRGLC